MEKNFRKCVGLKKALRANNILRKFLNLKKIIGKIIGLKKSLEIILNLKKSFGKKLDRWKKIISLKKGFKSE